MKKIALLIACFLQIAFLIYLIFTNQAILKTGEQYKFKVRPIDPYNIFKGRYLTLAFEEEQANPIYDCPKNSNNKSFAIITKDKNGFAQLQKITNIKPKENNYFELKTNYCQHKILGNFKFPFDEFYLQETMAKKTEEDYKESLKIKNNNSYALVRIQGGKAVLEDLYINDKSVNNNLQGKPKI